MSRTVISVENLSKQYRLGLVGTGTLSHDLNRFWAKIRGKEDPYSLVGDVNDRTQSKGSDYVWALKDINFDVKEGQVLGIIGKNGAGKSTLLKILSSITTPTTGSIKIKGRIASLLEVGTGFHPELTGRENIFLNGAILGMRKWEIKKKLDEIVSFAGTEKYIDTPVKRYSSGMKVRLGFAVAAHLDPEILIVDEVLAVGDADFQAKCLGKMGDIAKGEGKTILFVSHNMSAIRNLCAEAVLIHNGTIVDTGEVSSVVQEYLKKNFGNIQSRYYCKGVFLGRNYFKSIEMLSSESEHGLELMKDHTLEIEAVIGKECLNFFIAVSLYDASENLIFISTSEDSGLKKNITAAQVGVYKFEVRLPSEILKPGEYRVRVNFHERGVGNHDDQSINLRLVDTMSIMAQKNLYRPTTIISPKLSWKFEKYDI